jgi:hypothetical protein
MMPARTQAIDDKKSRLIADLDEIISEVCVLKIKGQEYELKPVVGFQLRQVDEALTQVRIISNRLMMGENLEYDEMIKAYFKFCHIIIPELTLDVLHGMTTKQVNELFKICVKFASDQDLNIEAKADENQTDEKKNSLK